MRRRPVLIPLLLALGFGLGLLLVLRRSPTPGLAEYLARMKQTGEARTLAETVAQYSDRTNDSLAIITNAATALGSLGAPDLVHYESPGKVRVVWKSGQPYWRSAATNAPIPSWQELDQQLARQAPALDELRRALARPEPNAGRSTNLYVTTTPLVELRSCAQGLATDCLDHLHFGRNELAIADLQALLGLVQIHREECRLVVQMIRMALAGEGTALTWQVLQNGDVTPGQLANLQRSWEEIQLLAALERGSLHGRFAAVEMAEGWLRQPVSDPVLTRDYWYSRFLQSGDMLLILRNAEAQIEQARSLAQGVSWVQASNWLNQSERQLNAWDGPIGRWRYPMTSIVHQNFGKFTLWCVRAELERRLTLTSIALTRFRRQYGHWPAQLSELTPEFLAQVPVDLIDGKPLRYQLRPGGRFRLYSVGMNGRDDGGDPQRVPGGASVGIWDGRDAVWPEPAD